MLAIPLEGKSVLHNRTGSFYLLSLGCPKNDVDSDFLASILMGVGWSQAKTPQESDLMLVNTCSFIAVAVEETVEAILDISDLKDGGRRKLVVAGCLVSRYGASVLGSLMPEVDMFLDFPDYRNFASLISTLFHGEGEAALLDSERRHSSTLDEGYVFIKISEGCRRRCAFCAIPAIRGRLCSRRWEDIYEEASFFLERGAKELVLIAQDTTSYGLDLYGRPSLPLLIEHLVELDGDYRLRLMYMHPEGINREILEVMQHPKVCPYLDIPLQHVAPFVLEGMGRRGGRKDFEALLDTVRNTLKKSAIRSTFMVGFPGEDEGHFMQLYNFIAETRFDWIGLFRYSQEEGTRAFPLGSGAPEVMVRKRLEKLAELQEEIMRERALGQVGEAFRVLVEGMSLEAPGYWEARSWREAPEIDGVIFLPDDPGLKPGMWCEVEIKDTEGIDLIGAPKTHKKGDKDNRGRG